MELKINDRIRNRKVDFFNKFNVHLKYDAMASSFSFEYFFDPAYQEHIDLACIGHYHLCTVRHNDELLLTGQILSEEFKDSPKREPVAIGGYSIPGVLEDCEIPPDISLQSDLSTLRQICSKILEPFGIQMIVDPIVSSAMDEPYDESTADRGQSIKSYFSELASQKNIVISHTAEGNLLFTRLPVNKRPITDFDGGIPSTTMTLSFNGQGMHSHITAMDQADTDDPNASENPPLRNPYVINSVYRPHVVIQNAGKNSDTPITARNILSQELKNLQLSIVTDRWIIDGKVIKPGNIISVTNPRVYLFKKTNWFIEEVQLQGDQVNTIATLKCVLPSVYDGSIPPYIFAGINLH